jgi:hypothetical protein
LTVKLAYLFAAIAVAIPLAGCGGGSSAHLADQGCAQIVLGVEGRVVPETSGLSCAGVKEVIGGAVPATAGGYLLGAGEPEVTWKCHMYPSQGSSADLLSCSHGKQAFAIRRVR